MKFMKQVLTILLTFALLSTPLSAQKRRSAAAAPKEPAVPALEQARQAMKVYDFDGASAILSKAIAEQEKKRKPTEDVEAMEELLDEAQRIGTKLHATERIVVIDSVVCPKEQILKIIRLTHESGRLDTYASTYHTRDTLGAFLYENELANKRYLAVPTTSKKTQAIPALHLAVSDKIGEQWSNPTTLTGLGDDDTMQNFPYLLSDGVTLYYAAISPESIGGYDIFVTRADGEDGTFLSPENVGFPFNSPDNDYLLAIDELAQLGWFVTDRHQPEGKVCVYIFIPNDTREVYGDETSYDELRSLARLTSLRETWKTASASHIKEAQQRLADLRAGKAFGQKAAPDFVFVIDDARTYTHLTDFRCPAAKEKMQQYLRLEKAVDTDAILLQRLRDNFAEAKADQRKQLAETITRLEQTHYPQLQQLQQLAKEVRNAEITYK